jgi:hypothetical protein
MGVCVQLVKESLGPLPSEGLEFPRQGADMLEILRLRFMLQFGCIFHVTP